MNYTIMEGCENMDFKRVTEMLATSFWVRGIMIDEVVKGAQNSAMVIGAFDSNKQQIGYARSISDKTRFAYILDVFVEVSCRKQGIGQAMVKHLLNHPEMKDVYQWMLITKDAHTLYGKLGFTLIERVGDWMEIRNPRNR